MKLYDMLLTIYEKMERLDSRIDNVDKQLAIYNEQLTQHIEGVKQAKEENKLLREYIDLETQKLSERLKPIEDLESSEKAKKEYKKSVLETSLKILTLLSLLTGLIWGISSRL